MNWNEILGTTPAVIWRTDDNKQRIYQKNQSIYIKEQTLHPQNTKHVWRPPDHNIRYSGFVCLANIQVFKTKQEKSPHVALGIFLNLHYDKLSIYQMAYIHWDAHYIKYSHDYTQLWKKPVKQIGPIFYTKCMVFWDGCQVDRWKSTSISEKHSASIFRVRYLTLPSPLLTSVRKLQVSLTCWYLSTKPQGITPLQCCKNLKFHILQYIHVLL